MIRKTHRIRRIVVGIALAASAAAWTAQPALAFDGRAPDTRDAAEAAESATLADRRSPDTRDRAESAAHAVILRSPDTADTRHWPAGNAPVESPAVGPSDQLGWEDFGLGLALALAAIVALAGGAFVARKRRSDGVGPATT